MNTSIFSRKTSQYNWFNSTERHQSLAFVRPMQNTWGGYKPKRSVILSPCLTLSPVLFILVALSSCLNMKILFYLELIYIKCLFMVRLCDRIKNVYTTRVTYINGGNGCFSGTQHCLPLWHIRRGHAKYMIYIKF